MRLRYPQSSKTYLNRFDGSSWRNDLLAVFNGVGVHFCVQRDEIYEVIQVMPLSKESEREPSVTVIV